MIISQLAFDLQNRLDVVFILDEVIKPTCRQMTGPTEEYNSIMYPNCTQMWCVGLILCL